MLATGARALLAVVLGAMAAEGQGDEHGSLRIGGYVRALAGLQQLPYERAPDGEGPGPPERVGLSATVLRLEWKLTLGERCSAEAHQRAFLRISSDSLAPAGGRLGLGASVVPRRSVNLRWVAYGREHLLLDHDLDRLVLRANLGHLDLSVGRQAITWGTGEIFPVADMWANYSPFEIDTSQKRGIDALRALFSYSRAWELEAVLADRGSLNDLSGGPRLASYGQLMDATLAVAKQWRELVAILGTAATAGNFKLRAEAVGPLDLDQRDVMAPRLAIGRSVNKVRDANACQAGLRSSHRGAASSAPTTVGCGHGPPVMAQATTPSSLGIGRSRAARTGNTACHRSSATWRRAA